MRRAMERTGRDVAALAETLGWSPAWLELVLAGCEVPSSEDVAAMLAVCGVVGAARGELLALTRTAAGPSWWQEYVCPPVEVLAVTAHEEAARVITSFHTTLVPDLARTPAYTRALLRAVSVVPEGDVEQWVAATRWRQRVLDQAGARRYRVFLHEYVLTRIGPGREVMAGQVRHLLGLIESPRVVVRVVPEVAPAQGMTSFTLLEFIELAPVVHVECDLAIAVTGHTDTVAGYRRHAEKLDRIALDEDASRRWLVEAATHLEQRVAGVGEGGGYAEAPA